MGYLFEYLSSCLFFPYFNTPCINNVFIKSVLRPCVPHKHLVHCNRILKILNDHSCALNEGGLSPEASLSTPEMWLHRYQVLMKKKEKKKKRREENATHTFLQCLYTSQKREGLRTRGCLDWILCPCVCVYLFLTTFLLVCAQIQPFPRVLRVGKHLFLSQAGTFMQSVKGNWSCGIVKSFILVFSFGDFAFALWNWQ